MKKPNPYSTLLLQALMSEVGILVSTPDPEKLRQRLYAARGTDTSGKGLSFQIPTMENALFIINTNSAALKEAYNGPQETTSGEENT